MFGDFAKRQIQQAFGRIVYRRHAALDLSQHHEVVEIPMQNRRQAQLAQLGQIQLDRTRGQMQLVGDTDHMVQSRAFQRHRKLAAQAGDVEPVAVVGCHHRQTGQPAFGGFGLQNQRGFLAAGKIQHGLYAHRYTRPAML